jgi:hypothetical protein
MFPPDYYRAISYIVFIYFIVSIVNLMKWNLSSLIEIKSLAFYYAILFALMSQIRYYPSFSQFDIRSWLHQLSLLLVTLSQPIMSLVIIWINC